MKPSLLLSSMQEELNNVRNLKIYKFLNFLLKKKKLCREVFCCVSEQSYGVGCCRQLPKEIMRKLGGEARQFVTVQWIERFGIVWRWRWGGQAFALRLLWSLEEKMLWWRAITKLVRRLGGGREALQGQSRWKHLLTWTSWIMLETLACTVCNNMVYILL